ncbi:MAG: hypothetical protein HY889_10600 [Deltaproteobacteria bacterium]|nr:hypothetical protein [Deltaproteobacteria bacterium]
MEYKARIVRFWQEYLPGTPPERFDWMRTNPAGPAIWFFAIDEKTSTLAGAISLMPKDILVNGRPMRAGIMGDYMIGSRYRVFGPALDLQRAVTKDFSDLGFSFIYTVPNQASIKIIERMGFVEVLRLRTLVKPVKALPYLKKYVNPAVARLTAPVAELAMKIRSRETYVASDGVFEEVEEADGRFDRFWRDFKADHMGVTGEQGSSYLQWKYFNNPVKNFRILACVEDGDGGLLGYICFAVNNDKMEIHDIVAREERHADKLLKQLIIKAGRERCKYISIMLSEKSPWVKRLKAFLFLDANSHASVYCYGDMDAVAEKWHFFEGERNI